MTTLADLVAQTEEHLLAGARDELNQLAATVDTDDTEWSFTYELSGVQQGAYVSVDLEIVYVWDTNDSAKTATVQRGMLGSTPAAHTGGSIAYANPKFSKWAITKALNQEIVDLSAPPNGLFRPRTFTTTTSPVAMTYPIPVDNDDIIDVLDIRYDAPGAEHAWPRVTRYEYRILRGLPTATESGSASGLSLRVNTAMYPGRDLLVTYSAPFLPLAALADDVEDVTGLPTSAVDIPPLGAAARLMGVREARRAFVEDEVDSRRANEVPPGSAAKAAAVLLSILDGRIKTEYLRLIAAYPQTR